MLPDARRKKPVQSRANATMRAIRDAFLLLLKEEGRTALTTNRIAEVAGVSIGSLYQYYKDKYAIAVDICNEVLREEMAMTNREAMKMLALAPQSLEETIALMVRGHVQRERRLYALLRDFYQELHWRYDFGASLVEHFSHHLFTEAWLPRLFAMHADELRVSDWPRAAALVVDVIEGSIHRALDRRPEAIFEDRFVDELAELVLCYLKKT